jgi:hypothetical protein
MVYVDASRVEERHAVVFVVTQEQREFGAAEDDGLDAIASFQPPPRDNLRRVVTLPPTSSRAIP